MFRIMVTGKPSEFTLTKPLPNSKVTAKFILTEKRWVQGQNVEFRWSVCVPAHKEMWARAQVEKGYTVAVEASDMEARINIYGGEHFVEMFLMLTEITGI